MTAEVIIDLRLVDPSTSELVYSAKGEGKASQTGVATDLASDDKTWSAGGNTSTPLGQASRDALTNAVKALMVGMPKRAIVAHSPSTQRAVGQLHDGRGRVHTRR
ncbi:MAG TPA: CsgG/HfaB family protein [Gemmatimonadaceae bacterium]